MKLRFAMALALSAFIALSAAAPKTDVVIETTDGALLHVEYISETDKVAVIDIRAAILPAAICEQAALPKYLPKDKFRNPAKMASGHCRFVGSPFVARTVNLTLTDIRKRYDTALVTLTADGKKKQVPFFQDTSSAAQGFDLTAEPAAAMPLGVAAFAKDKSMDTMQTIDMAGKRETLYPPMNLWHRWNKLDPRVGLTYSPLIPIGSIGTLKFGMIGVGLYNSVAVPNLSFLEFLQKRNFRLRAGLIVGYHRFSQDIEQNGVAASTGTISLIPVLFQAALYYDLRPKGWGMTISPSFKLAQGLIFSSVATQVKPEYVSQLSAGAESSRSGSYMGYAVNASLGAEFRHDKLKNLAYFVDFGFMYHAESTAGTFVTMSLGAAYHYGTTPPEPKMLPVQYLGAKSIVLGLRGTVKTPDGTPLAGATLKLRAKGSDAVVKQIDTNDKGQYAMELEPGLDYEIEARKDAYIKTVADLPLTSNDKKTRDQDFILAPLTYSLEGVNFKPDSDQLVTGKAPEKALLELVKFLQANPEIRVEIGGHTAARGDDDDNSRNLSKKRAESVRKFIIDKGIKADRLTAEGYGGSKPIADGKTAEGAAKNRRVEVRVLTE